MNIKGDHQVVVSIVLVLTGIFIGITINKESINIRYELVIIPFATLLAAFFGSWYAFRLSSDKAEREQINQNLSAGNQAIFTLTRMFNQLITYKNSFINPISGEDYRWYKLLPCNEIDHKHLTLDDKSLSFLINTKFRNILGHLYISEDKFHVTFNAINDRSKLMLGEVHERLEASGIDEETQATEDDYLDAIGPRFSTILPRQTDQIIELVNKSIDYINQTSRKLTSDMKELFPDYEVIKMQLGDNTDNSPNEG